MGFFNCLLKSLFSNSRIRLIVLYIFAINLWLFISKEHNDVNYINRLNFSVVFISLIEHWKLNTVLVNWERCLLTTAQLWTKHLLSKHIDCTIPFLFPFQLLGIELPLSSLYSGWEWFSHLRIRPLLSRWRIVRRDQRLTGIRMFADYTELD